MISPTLTAHLLDYAVNTIWQLPLLAASTWLLIRLCRPSTTVQHCLWIATLILAATLPLRTPATPIVQPFTPKPTVSSTSHRLIVTIPTTQRHLTPFQFLTMLRPHAIQLDARVITQVLRLWLLALAINLCRLTLAWFTSHRLIARAHRDDDALDPAFLAACAAQLAIPVPEIRFLESPSATPVVAGIFHPVLLLPTHLAHDYELTAILLHEFAHIRRRDTLANLFCRVIALPIAWHPVTPLLHARIGQTREILCDALAAQATGSSTAYARSLLSLARNLNEPSPESHLATLPMLPAKPFNRTRLHLLTPLEERIMKLIAPASPKLSHRAVRITVGVAVMLTATLAATAFHLQAASAAEEHHDSGNETPTTSLIRVYSLASNSTWRVTTHPASPMKGVTVGAARIDTYLSKNNGATWQAAVVPQAVPQQPQPPALPPLPAMPPAPTFHETPSRASDIDPAPQAPVAPPAPQAAPTPLPAPVPPSAPKTFYATPGHPITVVNGVVHEMTPAEKIAFDKQIASMNQQLQEMLSKQHLDEKARAAGLKAIQSPEFKRQMAEVQKQIDSPEFEKQIAEATKLATDRAMNSEELRRQLDDAAQQIKVAQAQIAREHVNIQIDSAKIQAQIKAATNALAHTKIPTDIHIDTAEIQRQLDQAQQQIDEARKRVPETAPKQ